MLKRNAQIEREKTDLTVQLMGLSDRLDEAEGGAEHVIEANKKRDSELAKLRKLLEDVHLESEETAHHLRQKHQAAVAEFQDQFDQLQKAKNRYKSGVIHPCTAFPDFDPVSRFDF